MKSERNIFIAFILNFSFSIFECIGGIFTGSVAIISDAVHDIGDATSIGIAFFLEKKSKRQPDEKYTYGYTRYAFIGGLVTTVILLFGSIIVVYNAIGRIIHPVEIDYNGMIIFAVVGVGVNFVAAIVTRKGDTVNQKAVTLHMLEDVLGWIVVLVGAIVMRFTDISIIDPILSIGIAVFIFINAVKSAREILETFLEKTPDCVDISRLKNRLCEIEGVLDVHHMHAWKLDEKNYCATMHVVVNGNSQIIKTEIRAELQKNGIRHATLEVESEGEECTERDCHIETGATCCHHHHH